MNTRSHDSALPDEAAACAARVIDAAAVERTQASLPAEDKVQAVADIFSALSDSTRLRILLALAEGEMCVCDLAAVSNATSSAVSHQLRILRDRDLVAYRRDGKRAVYRLADVHVAVLLEQGLAHAAERL